MGSREKNKTGSGSTPGRLNFDRVAIGGRTTAEVFAANPTMLKATVLQAMKPALPVNVSLDHAEQFAQRVTDNLLELYRAYGLEVRK